MTEGLIPIAYGSTVATYALATVGQVGALFFRRWGRLALWLTLLAWAAHSLAIGLGALAFGRYLILHLFGAVLFFTWLGVTNYLVFHAFARLPVLGSFVIPVAFLLLSGAGVLGTGMTPVAGGHVDLTGAGVAIHVVLALSGYGALALSFVAGVMYLLLERQLKGKTFRQFLYRLPSLAELDRLGYRLVAFGFPLLSLAILTGAFQAQVAWGRYWDWDPKETWSLLTWLIYGGYLLSRRLARWSPRRAAWLAVVGFAAVLVNLFVINLWVPGLHKFGS